MIFHSGAKIAREVVFSVLRDACIDGDLSIPEALAVVKHIFAETAKQFYKLNVSSRYSDVEPLHLSTSFEKEQNSPLRMFVGCYTCSRYVDRFLWNA